MARRALIRETKTHKILNKGNFLKYVILPCFIAFIVSCVYAFWYTNNQNSTYTNIEYIRSFMTSSGRLNDFQNKLMMHDPKEDIKWYKTDDEIRIEFGCIPLTWKPEDFYAEENLAALETIGFTIDIKTQSSGKKLYLYWNGEEVERWVK